MNGHGSESVSGSELREHMWFSEIWLHSAQPVGMVVTVYRVGDWTVFGTLYAVLYLNAQVHAVLENVTAHPDGVSRPTKIM